MERGRAIEAADVLVASYRGEARLPKFPDSCAPKSIADAQQILTELALRMDQPVVGWKLYFPFKATETNLYAPIFNVYPSGTPITAKMANMRKIEPEIVYRAERDFPPQTAPYTFEDVAAGVSAIPAFEFLGSRFTDPPVLGQKAPATYADNTLSGGFIIGEAKTNWRELDFMKMRIVTTFDGKVVSDETGGHPVKDPFILVYVGVNLIRDHGGVKKGQILATLSPTGLLDGERGVHIVADFHGFGRIETSYAF